MGQLEDLRAFVQIVEQESIGKAAEQAGIAKSAMSRRLRLLEERMQTELITRTTRQWTLTEAGRQYYQRGLSIVSAFDEFESQVRNETLELRGDIRLSVPLYFGQMSLQKPLLVFAKNHPEIRLDIEFNDRIVDVIGEGFDLVIRISELQDSTLIARKLCQTRHVFCASPDYLANNSKINKPSDLKSHRIIHYGSTKRPKWTFALSGGKVTTVPLSASMNSHDGGFLVAAAENGFGIVRVPDFLANTSLESGLLVQILKPYELKPGDVNFVYPAARYLPHRTRALMDFLLTRFRQSHIAQ